MSQARQGLAAAKPPVQSPAVPPETPRSPEPESTGDWTLSRQSIDPAGFPASDVGSQLPSYISPRALTLLVAGGLIAAALVAWLAVGVHLAHMRQLQLRLAGTFVDSQELQRVSVMLRFAQITQAAVFGLTALAFLAWLFRLRVNVRALGMRKFVFPRQWCVLGFLIPVVNFVRPYQVIKEVWRASDPSVLDPFEWKFVDPPRLLTLWWGTFVIAATFQLAAFGLAHTAGVAAFKVLVVSGVAVVANLVTGLSASLAYFLVTRLAAAQAAKFRRLQGDDEGA